MGYKNVKIALWSVFNINLDDIQIREGEYENFGFTFQYKDYSITMILSGTGKYIQFEFGEGGTFDILLHNPKYPRHSFLEKIFFYNLLADKELKESVKYVFGKNEKDIEYAMQVLKDFLDSDDAKVLLRKESFIGDRFQSITCFEMTKFRMNVQHSCYVAFMQDEECYDYIPLIGAPLHFSFDTQTSQVKIQRLDAQASLSERDFIQFLALVDLAFGALYPLDSVVELNHKLLPTDLVQSFESEQVDFYVVPSGCRVC